MSNPRYKVRSRNENIVAVQYVEGMETDSLEATFPDLGVAIDDCGEDLVSGSWIVSHTSDPECEWQFYSARDFHAQFQIVSELVNILTSSG